MIEFGITLVLVVLLVVFFLNKRKKCSPCCSSAKNEHTPEQVKQQPEITPSETPIVKAEATAVNAPIAAATAVSSPEPKEAQPQPKAPVSPVQNDNSSAVPQDSILKRHYLTHIGTMIETLSPARPTDSVLCRHYDALLVAKLDQCLNDKKAMEQLVCDYEKHSA